MIPLSRMLAVGAIALGLGAVLVGVRVNDGGTGLIARPGALVGFVAFAMLAGLILSLPRPRLAIPAIGVPRPIRQIGVAALALSLPLWAGRYMIDTATLVCIYMMLAFGLNIVVGLTGLLDLGYVAFYAVGAYSYAILSVDFGWGFWSCLPVSGALAAACGIALGFPVLRLRGDYLAVVTLGFGEIIRVTLNNFTQLTNGPRGIVGIARPTIFGLSLSGNGPGSLGHFLGVTVTPIWRVDFLYYLILAMLFATYLFIHCLRRAPLGRALEALREDEIAARALGLNVTQLKLTAFATGAMFAGLAGCFFAARAAFVSPESFVFMESVTILAVVVLGGLGSSTGIALAAIVMIGGGEMLRTWLLALSQNPHAAWLHAMLGDIGQMRMLIFGLAMVGMMGLRPRGLVQQRPLSVTATETA